MSVDASVSSTDSPQFRAAVTHNISHPMCARYRTAQKERARIYNNTGATLTFTFGTGKFGRCRLSRHHVHSEPRGEIRCAIRLPGGEKKCQRRLVTGDDRRFVPAPQTPSKMKVATKRIWKGLAKLAIYAPLGQLWEFVVWGGAQRRRFAGSNLAIQELELTSVR